MDYMPEQENQEQQESPTIQSQGNQQSPKDDNASGFDIKTFLPIALGLVLVIFFFVKMVLPALEKDVDHSASGILEPTTERDYESFFGK